MASRGRLIGILLAAALLGAGMLVMIPGSPFAMASGGAGSQGFAADRGAPAAGPVPFDKARAMNYLREICAIGPRISATPGMQKQIDLLKKHFEAHGLAVELQKFQAKQRSQKEAVEMTNLIARWKPEAKRRIMLCAHYDTRPIADEEPDPRDWTKPFVSANDGGSGVALMMELAHHLRELNPEVGLDFVLFDGEEYIFTKLPSGQGGDKYFFGSEHFAAKYLASLREDAQAPRYLEAVLLDMIAGKTSKFCFEEHSYLRAGPLVEKIWKIAAEQGVKRFVPQYGVGVLDDHLALQDAGIMAIDIVPAVDRRRVQRLGAPFLDYPHWHKLSDIPENCSPEAIEEVARVLAVWIKRAK